MTIYLLLLLALAVLSVGAWLLRRREEGTPPDRSSAAAPPSAESLAERPEACTGCAVDDASCYADKLLRGDALRIDYFDDEELDAYRGTPSNAYTPEQAEAFREVLFTMQPHEVADWLHSLQLRGIELPDEVKDEAILLLKS